MLQPAGRLALLVLCATWIRVAIAKTSNAPDAPHPPISRMDSRQQVLVRDAAGHSAIVRRLRIRRSPPTGSRTSFSRCARGKLELRAAGRNERDFPFACLDETGNRLGPDDFVAGYTSVYAYGRQRRSTVELDHQRQPASARASSSGVAGPGELKFAASTTSAWISATDAWHCAGTWSGLGQRASAIPCVPTLRGRRRRKLPAAQDPAELVELESELPDTPNRTWLSNDTRDRNITEQMWINYYAEARRREIGSAAAQRRVRRASTPTTARSFTRPRIRG